MDGASKFVRGDAIAGILILFINIIGGLDNWHSTARSGAVGGVRNYTLLTIGDGLVAQIPSLLLSTAVAIIVTRVSRAQDMRKQIFAQLFSDHRMLVLTAAVMAVLGMIPGMPNFAFITLALVCGFAAFRIARQRAQSAPTTPEPPAEETPCRSSAGRTSTRWT